MCYQIAKSIGEMAVVLEGTIDAIILTGAQPIRKPLFKKLVKKSLGLHQLRFTQVKWRWSLLYEGVNRVLTGEEQALNYSEAKIEQE